MAGHKFTFQNKFLQNYLTLVEDTESPRVFHIMSALTGIAACLGRRCFLPEGHEKKFPNLYVGIIGPPGCRKSTAIGITKYLLSDTNVRFAPSDTGGQRQGLINALEDKQESAEDKKLLDSLNLALESSVEVALGNIKIAINGMRDKHCLSVFESEMHSFIGTGSLDMMTFLNKMWDGENYEYRTKTSRQILHEPLMSFVAGNTAEGVSLVFPQEAIGGGFMSRILMVYSATLYKQVPNRPPLDPILEAWFRNVYQSLTLFEGEFNVPRISRKLLDDLYSYKVKINDGRFDGYISRRAEHLKKLCMLFAASRLDHTINVDDIREAHLVLEAIELYMPDALGQFGMSKLARAKQRIVETLKYIKNAIEPAVLYAMVHNDMTNGEFNESINDLISASKIMEVSIPGKGPAYVFMDTQNKKVEELLEKYKDQMIELEDPQEKTTADPKSLLRLVE